MSGHPRSLSWTAEDTGTSPGSQPAFVPMNFDRQGSAMSVGGATPQLSYGSDAAHWGEAPPFGAAPVGRGQAPQPLYGNQPQYGAPVTPPMGYPSGPTGADVSTTNDPEDPALSRFGDPRDDRPLLEELGIFRHHISAKSMAVLHPLRTMAVDTVEDSDIAGPLCFTVLLAFLLTLQGKLHFGAIYGLSVLGILLAYALLNLMSDTKVHLQLVISTLGYCLLPNTILAVFTTLHVWFIGRSPGVVLPLALLTIAWSAWCATCMFTQAFRLQHCRYLILYPATLFYAVFAALTIF